MPFARSAALLLLISAGPVAAQSAEAPPCAAQSSLPPELSGWGKALPLAAAGAAQDLAGAQLVPGKAMTATLLATPRVRYALPPEKPGAPATHGGMFGFTIAEAGRYRVALGAGAWIDVVRDGQTIASAAHGHGPACTGVRKMVDFDLSPGRYLLQVAGNATTTLPLMMVRLPG